VSRRTAARLGWSLLGLSALLLAMAFVLNLRRPQYDDLLATTGELLFALVILLSFGWFGALIVARRPSHLIGWILCALAATIALTVFANEYAIYGVITHPGAAPGAAALAWFTTWAIAIPFGLLAALLLLFPTGRPPSPGWSWWLWVAGLGNLLFILSHLSLWPLRGADLLRLDTSDPAGIPGVLFTIGATAGPVAVVAAGVSVLVRFRRVRGTERQQIKWLLYAVLTVILGYPLLIVAMTALGYSSELAGDVSVSLLVAPVPLAMGLAILRFRLYDIDRLINRTLVYGLLTVLLGALYAGVVLVLGRCLAASALSRRAGSWPARPWRWPPCSSPPAAASSRGWTAASTGASTTWPRPSRRSALACAMRSLWTRSRPSCSRWSIRRCSRPRRRCGFGNKWSRDDLAT
jgi:hypothetical protein